MSDWVDWEKMYGPVEKPQEAGMEQIAPHLIKLGRYANNKLADKVFKEPKNPANLMVGNPFARSFLTGLTFKKAAEAYDKLKAELGSMNPIPYESLINYEVNKKLSR